MAVGDTMHFLKKWYFTYTGQELLEFSGHSHKHIVLSWARVRPGERENADYMSIIFI